MNEWRRRNTRRGLGPNRGRTGLIRALTASAGLLLACTAHTAPPVAAFTLTPSSGQSPLTVGLDASAASDPDGNIIDYQWSSSDGQSSAGQITSLTFTTPGEYVVTLTVTDDEGESSSSSRPSARYDNTTEQRFSTISASTTHLHTLPAGTPLSDATLTIGIAGDYGSSTYEYASVYVDGGYVGRATGSRDCGSIEYTTLNLPAADLAGYATDGQVEIVLRNSSSVSGTCADSIHTTQLAFDAPPGDGGVNVLVAPEATFTATPNGGAAPLTVTLDATGSSDPDGRIVDYQWSSSDGQVTAGQSATMTFTRDGDYPVTLTVTDDDGLTSTHEVTISVVEQIPPVPSFTVTPTSGIAPLTVNLDAGSSHDPNGTIVDYQWSSSDGQSASGVSSTLTFTSGGEHIITLTVTDDQGLSATSDSTTPPPFSGSSRTPFATYSATTLHVFTIPSGDARSDASLRIGLRGHYGDSHYRYAEAFIDGTSLGRLYSSQNCGQMEYTTLSVPMADLQEHIADGEVVVELRNSYGVSPYCTASEHAVELSFDQASTGRISVQAPPNATFTATPGSGYVPLTVALDALASNDPDGVIMGYQWSTSDGQSSSSPVTELTFDTVGSHQVTLTVTDDDGLSTTHERSIEVTDQPLPPVPTFTLAPSSGAAPLTVSLDASTANDPDGEIVDYQWSSSDGQGASGRTAELTFDTLGSYTIALTVTDDQGLSVTSDAASVVPFEQTENQGYSSYGATTRHLFTIPSGSVRTEANLRIGIAGDYSSSYEYASVYIDGESVGRADGSRDCSTMQYYTFNVSHADMERYTADGEVLVEVRNSASVGAHCSRDEHEVQLSFNADVANPEITVLAAPEARFTLTPAGIFIPLTVELDASESSDLDGTIVRYQWSTSDGQSAGGERASLTFDSAGEHTVTLTVTDDSGFEGSTSLTLTAVAPIPLSYDTTSRLRPQVIAAGVSPSQVDINDAELDILALVRPGALPIETVSLRQPGGQFELAMIPAGVLANGDEIYRATFTFRRNAYGTQTMGTAWGPEGDQFNVVVTDSGHQRSHSFPNLEVLNAPAGSAATRDREPVGYNTTRRLVPQIVMAGFSPTILDIADSSFDIVALVRDGAIPIDNVSITQNLGGFPMAMSEAGELTTGDRLFKLTYTYPRGSFPEGTVMSTVWGDEPEQYGIQAVDEAQQRSHRFPDIEFGSYPALESE